MDFYGNMEEAIPSNVPTPYGKEMMACCFVDADHTTTTGDNKLSRRSCTGLIISVNGAPIV